MEVLIDKDLYFLLNVLLDLDNYQFDSDITALIDSLQILVSTRLLQNFDYEKYDINDINNENVVYKFYSNKRKNN